ncbi:hypothetical protein MUN84_13025 [Hymenobacter sp. 5516J-16]|uniref:hypothetical protein n=1 Tax=Hymenobacter sp. 5516J-16 TaxID=2932253 RepID=UPI001FD607F5|nr:hypothetical protein [Hymenobacter sp. 5516J-16]UOQ75608.1 hypothetical protein MUN84_13025 [Hymenobacter sp. 5516J-16]
MPNRPLVVVAPLTLASFAGTRPSLPAAVQWVPLPLPDSVTWPVAAWRPHPDSLGLLLASGVETGIAFRRVRRSWPATSGPITGLGPGCRYNLMRSGSSLQRRTPAISANHCLS